RVSLEEKRRAFVRALSGGQKQRLSLACALVGDPELLFLDEPTTGLDPQSRSSLWEEVERLAADEGMTVFLTTQYLEEADRLADRVGIIDRGRIVAEGTPAALKAEIGEPSVTATAADPADGDRLAKVLERFGAASGDGGGEAWVRLKPGSGGLVAVVRELDAAGVAVADLQLHEPSLDDVFREKTGRKLEGAGEGTGEHDAVPAEAA
ncbi:MAG: ABC transporter ATP-binding protein, partial [Solirubrobacterales bacterium]|nr:ABC transporter ATP-binding protein [Solirubrobacterales bacterium]